MCKIYLDNSYNTRSLSYLVNKENKRIKDNLLIRSDNLSIISLMDVKTLVDEYKLKNIIDLRTEYEALNEPDKKIIGVSYFLNPILENDKIGITKNNKKITEEEFIRKLYSEGIQKSLDFMDNTYKSLIGSNHSLNAYKSFVNYLLELDGAILFHCSAGKDRAGFAAVIILLILDFDYNSILDDYLLTNDNYAKKVEKECLYYGKEYKEILECIYGVKKEYLEALLNDINTMYGSFDGFLLQYLGVNLEIKNKLKEKYLV